MNWAGKRAGSSLRKRSLNIRRTVTADEALQLLCTLKLDVVYREISEEHLQRRTVQNELYEKSFFDRQSLEFGQIKILRFLKVKITDLDLLAFFEIADKRVEFRIHSQSIRNVVMIHYSQLLGLLRQRSGQRMLQKAQVLDLKRVLVLRQAAVVRQAPSDVPEIWAKEGVIEIFVVGHIRTFTQHTHRSISLTDLAKCVLQIQIEQAC